MGRRLQATKLKPQKNKLHLFVFSPLHGIQETMEALNQALIYMIIVIFVLAVAVSWVFSRSMSASIRSLRRTTRQIAEGDYAARSSVRRSDELGELAGDFNSMARQLELALHKLQQFETRRRHFIMDVTHELRTPLTSIRGIIEGLKNDLVHSPEERANCYGIIEKETFRLTGSETEAHTVIVIADTGRGMSKEELALIWERFYKADPSRSKSNSETGLGLSIVKRLVEAHAGTIEADSTPGIDTSFTITLPKTDRTASPDGEAG